MERTTPERAEAAMTKPTPAPMPVETSTKTPQEDDKSSTHSQKSSSGSGSLTLTESQEIYLQLGRTDGARDVEAGMAELPEHDFRASTSPQGDIELPPYPGSHVSKKASQGHGLVNWATPAHFMWPQDRIQISQLGTPAGCRTPAPFPSPPTRFSLHVAGTKRYCALVVVNTLLVAYLAVDMFFTSRPESAAFRDFYSLQVCQALEIGSTLVILLSTLYLLGCLIFYKAPYNFITLKKASRAQKWTFAGFVLLAFIPLILAGALTRLHKDVIKTKNQNKHQTKPVTCQSLGYQTSVMLQGPTLATRNRNNATYATFTTDSNVVLMNLTTSNVRPLHQTSNYYFTPSANSKLNYSIEYVPDQYLYTITIEQRLSNGIVVPVIVTGNWIDTEHKFDFPNLETPLVSNVVEDSDWRYNTFAGTGDLELFKNETGIDTAAFRLMGKQQKDGCSVLRACSMDDATSEEVIVIVGVLLAEFNKYALANCFAH